MMIDLKKTLTSLLYRFSTLIIPEKKELEKLSLMSLGEFREILPKSEFVETEGVYSIFNYRNKNVRSAIWAIKYRLHQPILSKMGQILYEEIISIASEKLEFEGKDKIALIPAPINDSTRRNRGFNQTEEITKYVAGLSPENIQVFDILEKVRDTGHQTALSRRERLQNIKGSMRVKTTTGTRMTLVPPNFFPILIDDVCTTGATITEMRRALKEAGIESEVAITLAH